MAQLHALRSPWCLSCRRLRVHRKHALTRISAEKDNTDRAVRAKDPGAGLKAAWYGAEVFGNLMARAQGKPAEQQGKEPSNSSNSSTKTATAAQQTAAGVKSIEAVLQSIRADYAEDYFISGQGEMADYDPQCLFADPFVSFRGVDRFKKNVANLGALISDVELQITKWDVIDNTLEAHWKFSAVLDLPWKPRLAAAGSTTHIIDVNRGLVVEHIERWKSEPGEVVARLLKPAAKIPTNPWEVFMASASKGDYKTMWYVVSRRATFLAAPVLIASLAAHQVTGQGLPGFLGGSFTEVLAGLLVVAGLITEVVMYSEGTGQV